MPSNPMTHHLERTPGELRHGWPYLVVATLLTILGATVPAGAMTIHGTEVVIPVVAHAPGLEGSQWRSDVWIANPYSDALEVTLTYFPVAGGELTATVTVEGYRGAYLPDIVLETFGLDSSKGMLIAAATSRIELRARIYNTGNPCGEFGQSVPGLPLERLSSQGFLSGLGTAGGSRLNVGFANPADRTITISIHVDDMSTGEQFYLDDVVLGPHQMVQLDRLGERFGFPGRNNLVVRAYTITGDTFYAYASVVRNDSGDAIFIYGTAPNRGPS